MVDSNELQRMARLVDMNRQRLEEIKSQIDLVDPMFMIHLVLTLLVILRVHLITLSLKETLNKHLIRKIEIKFLELVLLKITA